MMRRTLLAAGVAALAGCASSGVIPTGQGTYMVTKRSAAGVATNGNEILADLYIEANAYCASHGGGSVQTVNTNSQNAIPFARMPNAKLDFSCVPPKSAGAASSPE